MTVPSRLAMSSLAIPGEELVRSLAWPEPQCRRGYRQHAQR